MTSGAYAGAKGVVESVVFQRTVDLPGEFAAGYHDVLDDQSVITVQVERVESSPNTQKSET